MGPDRKSMKCTNVHTQGSRWGCWLKELCQVWTSLLYIETDQWGSWDQREHDYYLAFWFKKSHYYFPVSKNRNTYFSMFALWLSRTHTGTHMRKQHSDKLMGHLQTQWLAPVHNGHGGRHKNTPTYTVSHIQPRRSVIWVICTLKLV